MSDRRRATDSHESCRAEPKAWWPLSVGLPQRSRERAFRLAQESNAFRISFFSQVSFSLSRKFVIKYFIKSAQFYKSKSQFLPIYMNENGRIINRMRIENICFIYKRLLNNVHFFENEEYYYCVSKDE